MNTIYKCPVCGAELTKTVGVFSCPQKHSYDIAKQGYVNLLLANQKRTKEPGDSKEMIASREYFLEQGYYDPLSDKLNQIILGWIAEPSKDAGTAAKTAEPAPESARAHMNILDLGCGEGFYSRRLQSFLEDADTARQVQIWGIDISKSAIQKAAKKNPSIQFCIGSNFQLPYLKESFDVIFSIFSPFSGRELARVLKPDGKIIVVRPGPGHLKELASLLYEKFELQGKSPDAAIEPDLQPLQTFEVKYPVRLKTNRDIESLVGMTPYFWTLNDEKKQRLSQQQDLPATADFRLSCFKRAPAAIPAATPASD
jgi:23S rRNA (guanine745-N1)-methyltransferase